MRCILQCSGTVCCLTSSRAKTGAAVNREGIKGKKVCVGWSRESLHPGRTSRPQETSVRKKMPFEGKMYKSLPSLTLWLGGKRRLEKCVCWRMWPGRISQFLLQASLQRGCSGQVDTFCRLSSDIHPHHSLDWEEIGKFKHLWRWKFINIATRSCRKRNVIKRVVEAARLQEPHQWSLSHKKPLWHVYSETICTWFILFALSRNGSGLLWVKLSWARFGNTSSKGLGTWQNGWVISHWSIPSQCLLIDSNYFVQCASINQP